MRKLSLFSGIGGIDLAAHWAGMETVAFCERESYPVKVLQKNFPGVPIYDDVKTLTKARLIADGIIGNGRTIDIVSAGYPCQPFSNAGKREGQNDDRHLWPEVKRLLEEIRPRWFVGENVAGHVTLGLDDVLSDLGDIGYTAQPIVIPAAAVSAPHRRDRVFIVGYSERGRCSREPWGGAKQEFTHRYLKLEERILANSSSSRQSERDITTVSNRTGHGSRGVNEKWTNRAIKSQLGRVLDGVSRRLDGHRWPAGQGAEQYDWEPPRVAAGVKNRVGRLKGLGNAVVPWQIYPIMAAIKEIDDALGR